jgi:hypothetical protein
MFSGKIEKGKLLLDEPSKYLVLLSSMEGKEIELVLRKRRSQRTLQQNKFYWAVIVEILSHHFGYEKDEMHEALKFKFLRLPTGDGRQLETVMSTTKLTTVGFVNYIDKIVRWAAQDYQIWIPDPGQVDY